MRGYMGARSQFDFGDEDVACENCGDNSGWTLWYTEIFNGRLQSGYPGYPVCVFVACADCNDDGLKPYPAPWPVCKCCEQSLSFCRCTGTSFPMTLPEFTN
jgi:hypothetical protein